MDNALVLVALGRSTPVEELRELYACTIMYISTYTT